MGSLIPVALDWATVSGDISSVLGNALVITLISVGIGLKIVPRFTRMLKRVT